MLSINCYDLTKRYGRVEVLDRLNWHVAPGQVVGLLGGSGAGKTTLLRLVAGLTGCTSGRIEIGETTDGPRRVGMVFQGLALWPHLTALEHLKCVLFAHGAGERRRRAEALLDEARLPAAVWNHLPSQLSGGEAQRLALARALAIEPHILLLDEPLAHLDPPLRAELLEVLRACLGSRRATCVFVTHSWDEAAALCQRIAVLDRGRLAQEGTPDDLYWRPLNEDVAQRTGPTVQLPVAWLRQGYVAAADPDVPLGLMSHASETILVRPQQLAAVDVGERNRWTVVERHPRGGGSWTTVTRDGERLSLLLPQSVPPGSAIGLELRSPDRGWPSQAVP
jgi:ABC-type Fe3+/spermidine/putrescine transport system ATPase subunit